MITVHRLCEQLKEIMKGTVNEPGVPSVFAAMDLGFHSVLGGDGPMYRSFLANRKFGTYSGRGIKPKLPEEEGYNKCRFRIVPFDHCFKTTREPITKRNNRFATNLYYSLQ